MRRNKHVYQLDENLADRMHLTEADRTAISVVGSRMKVFLNRPEFYAPLKDAPSIVQGFEYTLQNLWGFPLDSRYHRYQWDIKGCTCPRMDNLDHIGSEYRRYNQNCPVHCSHIEDVELL